MLTNLKKNHRYVFYKQLPGTDIITKFCAILISVSSKTLLVTSYKSEDQVYYESLKNCIWSIPIKWIKRVEIADEDETIDHDDIFIGSRDELIKLI